MPRKSRIDAPGAMHHIIARGIERCKIFRDDADCNNFLDRLGVIIDDTGTVSSDNYISPVTTIKITD